MMLENPSNWVQAKCSQPVPTQLGFNINKWGVQPQPIFFLTNSNHKCMSAYDSFCEQQWTGCLQPVVSSWHGG